MYLYKYMYPIYLSASACIWDVRVYQKARRLVFDPKGQMANSARLLDLVQGSRQSEAGRRVESGHKPVARN